MVSKFVRSPSKQKVSFSIGGPTIKGLEKGVSSTGALILNYLKEGGK